MTETLADSPKYPRVNVAVAAVLFSTAAPVTRFVEFGALSTTFFRSLTGLVALVLLAVTSTGRKTFRFSRYDFLGGLAYASTSLCFFIALNTTTVANATILFQTTPVFLIPLGYLFLRERAGRRDFIAIALMLAGIALCVFEGLDVGGQVGDLFALGGAVSFGLMSIAMKKNPDSDDKRLLIIGNIIIVLVTLPFQEFGHYRGTDIGLASGLGIVQMAIPLILISRGLRKLSTVEVSVIKNLETVLAPFWVALLIGEIPGIYTIAGFVAVMTAILIQAGKRG